MNNIFLIGNLTRDPELTETSGGVSVCRFSIAVNRKYADADGERKTDYFNCVSWRGQADNVAKFCRKGNKVAVRGSVEQRTYEDRNGNQRTAYDVIVQEVEFLTPRLQEDHADEVNPFTYVPRGDTRRQSTVFDDDDDIPY